MDRFRHDIAEAVQPEMQKASDELKQENIRRLLDCISKLLDRTRHLIRAGPGRDRMESLAEELNLKPQCHLSTPPPVPPYLEKMHGAKNTRIMNHFDKDPDFLDLLVAWHENKTMSSARRKQLLERLEKRRCNYEIGIG